MSKLIPRLSEKQMLPELAEMLRPRIERLGYLGEFFQCAANQPQVLMSFMTFTEDLKRALPDNLTEVVALTVAHLMQNAYERVQHERLCLKLGFSEAWVREVISAGSGESGVLTEQEMRVQKLVLAALNTNGHKTEAELEAVIRAIGPAQAVAVLMLIGRYLTHALVVNCLKLAPPVPSPFGRDLEVLACTPLWIREAEVVSMMNLSDAIAALEKGLLAEARGDAQSMVKTHVAWDGGSTLHAIGATFPKAGFAGTKTWCHTEAGATPLLVLFNSNTGSLNAVIEAFALGQLRTGAASGLATRWLAADNADELAIIGTGKQAFTQVAAIVAVRPIKRVRVFGRNPERRARFAARLKEELGLEIVLATSVAEAVKEAPIITMVTRAAEPMLRAEMVTRGAHINAVGAIVPTRAEFAADILPRCSRIVADSVPQAQKLSRELMDYFGPDPAGWQQVRSLASLVAAREPRAPGDDLTLFKSLGTGIADLSLGIEVYQKALQLGIGRGFPHPQKAAPMLRHVKTSHGEV